MSQLSHNMELLNIREHSGDYKSHRDIETAIAWSTVKKFLTEKNLNAIFDEISGIKITEKNISIVVRSQIAKTELSLYKEDISALITQKLSAIYGSHTRNVRII